VRAHVGSDIQNGYQGALGFNDSLAADGTTIALIFIGTNDVWWPDSPRHSDPEPFEV
jgi:hypothetical protein